MADIIEIKPYPEQRLRCELTQEERNAASDSMAQKVKEIQELEADLQSMSKQVKAQIAAAETEHERYCQLVLARAEHRNVKCEKHMNFTTGIVRIVRTDTFATVSERLMLEDEKQQQLPLPEDAEEEEDAPILETHSAERLLDEARAMLPSADDIDEMREACDPAEDWPIVGVIYTTTHGATQAGAFAAFDGFDRDDLEDNNTEDDMIAAWQAGHDAYTAKRAAYFEAGGEPQVDGVFSREEWAWWVKRSVAWTDDQVRECGIEAKSRWYVDVDVFIENDHMARGAGARARMAGEDYSEALPDAWQDGYRMMDEALMVLSVDETDADEEPITVYDEDNCIDLPTLKHKKITAHIWLHRDDIGDWCYGHDLRGSDRGSSCGARSNNRKFDDGEQAIIHAVEAVVKEFDIAETDKPAQKALAKWQDEMIACFRSATADHKAVA